MTPVWVGQVWRTIRPDGEGGLWRVVQHHNGYSVLESLRTGGLVYMVSDADVLAQFTLETDDAVADYLMRITFTAADR